MQAANIATTILLWLWFRIMWNFFFRLDHKAVTLTLTRPLCSIPSPSQPRITQFAVALMDHHIVDVHIHHQNDDNEHIKHEKSLVSDGFGMRVTLLSL